MNRPLPTSDRLRLKESLTRGRPFGDEAWTARTAARLGLEYTVNPRGRPKKQEEKS